MNKTTILVALWLLHVLAGTGCPGESSDSDKSQLANVKFSIVDAATAAFVPCRIHLTNDKGQGQLFDHVPSYRDHFCCDGNETVALEPGKYRYVIERGPEYSRCQGTFEVRKGGQIEVEEKLSRIANLAAEGWWSGELHVHRSIEDIELLMRAEDLHVAPTITWWNASNAWKDSKLPAQRVVKFDNTCFCDVSGGEDERRGGAYMFFNVSIPIDITWAEPEYPSPLYFIEQALLQPDAWIDIEKPFWWDVPVVLAHGYGDSIGLLNNHCCRSEMLDNEAWRKPRSREDFPSPYGNGLWSQQIYYHILNSGIRIAPSAGSASGVLPNPVGYTRVYVYLGTDKLDYKSWWKNLRKGRCFVTNGPLIRAVVEGHKPGHVFVAPKGQQIDLEMSLLLDSCDRIHRIEVIKNGVVEKTISYADFAKSGRIGTIHFSRSGWFLIRTIADIEHTFRFASTAPYYVEIGDEKHYLSRKSICFFLDWLDDRARQIKIEDVKKYRQVIKYHDYAKQFWQKRLEMADAQFRLHSVE
jgi:hypothetical protein